MTGLREGHHAYEIRKDAVVEFPLGHGFHSRGILVTAPIAAGSSANAAKFSFTQIDVPGASRTVARGINDAGQIVGPFDNSTGCHGFLYSGGSFTQIDMPGAFRTYRPRHQ